MGSTRLPSFFKTFKPKQFVYGPRYREAKREACKGEGKHVPFRPDFKKSSIHGAYEKGYAREVLRSNIRLIVIIFVLFLITLLTLKM